VSRVDDRFQAGRLWITLMRFEKAGDKLPSHTHEPKDIHVTFVTKGSFQCRGPDYDIRLEAGQFVDWDPGVYHEFEALEDDSRLAQVDKA
jgi:quercetin dioxygenase-like cupin family protein